MGHAGDAELGQQQPQARLDGRVQVDQPGADRGGRLRGGERLARSDDRDAVAW
jgi:hypothetical protein